MTIAPPPICWACKHLVRDAPWPATPTCAAYPDRIPDEIWEEQGDHRSPRPGDHGIQFELEPGKEIPEGFR